MSKSNLLIKFSDKKGKSREVSREEFIDIFCDLDSIILRADYSLKKDEKGEYRNRFLLSNKAYDGYINFGKDICDDGRFILNNLKNVICRPVDYCNCKMLGINNFKPMNFICQVFDKSPKIYRLSISKFIEMKDFCDSLIPSYKKEIESLIDNEEKIGLDLESSIIAIKEEFNLDSIEYSKRILSKKFTFPTRSKKFDDFISEYTSLYGNSKTLSLLVAIASYNRFVKISYKLKHNLYCEKVLERTGMISQTIKPWSHYVDDSKKLSEYDDLKDGILVRLKFNDLDVKCLLNNSNYNSWQPLSYFDSRFDDERAFEVLSHYIEFNGVATPNDDKSLVNFLSNEVVGTPIDVDKIVKWSLKLFNEDKEFRDCKLIHGGNDEDRNKEFVFYVSNSVGLERFLDFLVLIFFEEDSVSQGIISFGGSYEDCVYMYNKSLEKELPITFDFYKKNKETIISLYREILQPTESREISDSEVFK